MINNFFSTPVYVETLVGEELDRTQIELSNAIKEIGASSLSNPWDDTVLTNFAYGGNTDFVNHTPYFKEILTNSVQTYLLAFGKFYKNINFVDSWVNFSGRGGFQNYHAHPGFDISGCYYFKTNGQDGDIKFRNPNPNAEFNKLFIGDRVTINEKTKVGKLLLFPSFLHHAVLVNKTDDERISIAFNVELK
jgi:uncharacterized protein (TIGR02466 family)